MLLRRTDRLVIWPVLASLCLVWLVLVSLDLVLAFGGEKGDFSQAMQQLLLTLPRRLYELLPTAAVIGTVLALGQMASHAELTALRAAGVAKHRIVLAALAAVFALVVVMSFSAETLGPWGERRAQAMKVSQASTDVAVSSGTGFWVREGRNNIHARSARMSMDDGQPMVVLEGFELYAFKENGQLKSITQADKARYIDKQWRLEGVVETTFGADFATQATHERVHWQSNLDPAVLNISLDQPRYLATKHIRQAIAYNQTNGLNTGRLEQALWFRLFYPLQTLLLCFAVVPLAFGSLRSGGMGQRLFLGILFAISYSMLNRLLANLAQVYHIPQWLIYVVMCAVLLGLGVWQLRR